MPKKIKGDPLYIEGHIRTHSGKYFSFANPKPEEICIEDIAHSLSSIPRFLGHTGPIMTVAQHCVEAYHLALDTPDRIRFLLHDAHEAYTGDCPSPMRPFIIGLKKLQNRIDRAICVKFGIKFPIMRPDVKGIDRILVEEDWKRFMICSRGPIKPMPSIDAKKLFLQCFDEWMEKYGKPASV